MFENWVCFGTYFLYVHTLNPFLEKIAFLSYPCAVIWAFILINRRSFQLYFLRGGVLITPISSLLKTTSSIALHHQNERFRKKTLLLSNNADSAGNQYKLTRSSCWNHSESGWHDFRVTKKVNMSCPTRIIIWKADVFLRPPFPVPNRRCILNIHVCTLYSYIMVVVVPTFTGI